MAAPPHITIKDLSGKWVMNKTLSDDIEKILALQGINWFLRKAISLATITLTIHQYLDRDDPTTTHIDIQQTATGGISGTTELRTLDWTFRDHADAVFGECRGKSRWVGLGEVRGGEGEGDGGFLAGGWDDLEGLHVQSWVESKGAGWTADQVWGFEVVDGKRYYARHVVVRNGKDWKQARLVYDYLG